MNCLIKNGLVVNANAIVRADVRIVNGKISEIAASITATTQENVYDVAGRYLLPGGIDPHTHFALRGGNATADNFSSGTKAAVCGGTTTIIDFVTPESNQSLVDAFLSRKAEADNAVYCDYALHLSPLPQHDNESFERDFTYLVKNFAVTSSKIYLAYNNLMVDDQFILRILDFAKQHGIMVSAHCENGNAAKYLEDKAIFADKTALKYFPKFRSVELENEAVSRFLAFANIIDVPVYVVHVSSKTALAEITVRQEAKQKIFVETCPHYLYFDERKYLGPAETAARFMMAPPLRTTADSETLVAAIITGAVDTVGSDHCAINLACRELKLNDFINVAKGVPGVEQRYALMLSLLANFGDSGIRKAVEICSTNPAQIFGLSPHKGQIAVGSDADIVIWKKSERQKISASTQFQAVDFTPYEGIELTGKIETVFRNGVQVYNNGEFSGNLDGKYLMRSVTVRAK
ncbi:MAG: dihydropyrimidinase [Negativicutes bacterium]|jgi:dihydropyrimidinase